MRATVVALGDLERSPRIRYHARALARRGVDVELIGYGSIATPHGVAPGALVVRSLPAPRRAPGLRGVRFVLRSGWRALALSIRLAWLLLVRTPRPDLVLVQTPPAVPTLAIAWLAARLRASRLVVDWHNLGDTLLALRLGAAHPLVRLAGAWESAFGPRADAHLCVSEGMRRLLAERRHVREAAVLRDRPQADFLLAGLEAAGVLRRRLLAEAGLPPGEPAALAVSATSWGVDEDFDVLLDAADRLEQRAAGRSFPSLLVVVSGEGPLRGRFEERTARRRPGRIRFRTLWLPEHEYPLLLKGADIGISLHRASSGVDLPMKVADMLGAGLPVCGLSFPALTEQLEPGSDGLAFSSAEELADQLLELLAGFPRTPRLDALRRSVAERHRASWEDAWQDEGWPILRGGSGHHAPD